MPRIQDVSLALPSSPYRRVASGPFGRQMSWPHHMAAPSYGTVMNKMGLAISKYHSASTLRLVKTYPIICPLPHRSNANPEDLTIRAVTR